MTPLKSGADRELEGAARIFHLVISRFMHV